MQLTTRRMAYQTADSLGAVAHSKYVQTFHITWAVLSVPAVLQVRTFLTLNVTELL